MTRHILNFDNLQRRISARISDRMMRYFPSRVLDVKLSQPVVSFSFDDVPHSAIRTGATILERYNARGTFYIAGGLQDKVIEDTPLFSATDVQYLARAGHEVACHGFSHRRMNKMSRGVLERDLARNKAYLNSLDPQDTMQRNFAYPYNAPQWRARHLFADRFNSCRGGGNQINRGKVNRDLLYGVEIGGEQTSFSTLSSYIEDVAQNPGWLIFFTHDVDDDPSQYGCHRTLFEELVAFTVEKSCRVMTVKDTLSLLQGQDD
ncbi:polysaccharide deacetylase family protein [Brucellaceae bacterium C25G]